MMYLLYIYQDTMSALFKPSSATEKGTLYHLKNVFGHKAVKAEVKNCFSSCIEFLYFVTEAYICLHAVDILKLKTLKSGNKSDVCNPLLKYFLFPHIHFIGTKRKLGQRTLINK